jgi:uncharacterized protein (DUF1015 family)
MELTDIEPASNADYTFRFVNGRETHLSIIQPFRALRPAPGRAGEILAPPYDVLTSAEARQRCKDRPLSFLHISKPEIDLDPAIDPYSRPVYDKAAESFRRMIETGAMIRDRIARYYVYRLTWRGHAQTGLAAVASLADYAINRIRRHEFTTPTKEDDRVRQIEAVNAHTGPVMMAYPDAPTIDAMLAKAADAAPEVDVIADDGVRHQLWVIADDATIAALTEAFDGLPAIYIADGHHRAAAAARVASARSSRGAHDYFLSAIFPHHQMTILDYNRVVRDSKTHSRDQVLAALRERFMLEGSDQPVRPTNSGEFGMFLGGCWYRLTIRPDLVPNDPIGRLPVTLLARHVLEPLFGIKDQRTDKRIDFVGGARGLEGLESRVRSGEMGAAFALYPTQMTDLMAVADAGGVMPPKSTWFEPKLADGMVSHMLD